MTRRPEGVADDQAAPTLKKTNNGNGNDGNNRGGQWQ